MINTLSAPIALMLSISVNAGSEHRGIAIVEAGQRSLQGRNSPAEINVDPRTTYNEKFMTLMSSPCRPEYDGFFGATSGDPVRIQYGFNLEIRPLSPVMDILDIIEDKVVDSVLQSSFPEMCGLRRTRRAEESESIDNNPNRILEHIGGHPSGFRFLKFEQVGKCLPQVDDVNFCGVFTGVMYIYGKHQHGVEASRIIMTYINKVLDNSTPQDFHSELALISSVDELSSIQGDDSSQPSKWKKANRVGGKLSRLDTLVIIVSGLIFFAVVYYFYIQWHEQRRGDFCAGGDQKGTSSNLHIESDEEDDEYIDDEFIDEDLEFEPYHDDREKYDEYPSVI